MRTKQVWNRQVCVIEREKGRGKKGQIEREKERERQTEGESVRENAYEYCSPVQLAYECCMPAHEDHRTPESVDGLASILQK